MDDRPIYMISVAAELVGMHPQTLRIYESKGLLRPGRTPGGTRLYSENDLERLRTIQRLPRGSAVVFDYSIELGLLPLPLRFKVWMLRRRTASLGERMITAFVPAELCDALRQTGFSHVRNFDHTALIERYFSERTDGLAPTPASNLMLARV